METWVDRLAKQIPPDAGLKIGAANGHGFYYIGSYEHFRRNSETYDRLVEDAVESMARCAADRIRSSDFRYVPNMSEWVWRQMRTHGLSLKSIQEWGEHVLRLRRERERTEQRAQLIEKQMLDTSKLYTPLAERKVIESFWAIPAYEHNTLVVMLDGSEKGDVWCSDELMRLPYFAVDRVAAAAIDQGGVVA